MPLKCHIKFKILVASTLVSRICVSCATPTWSILFKSYDRVQNPCPSSQVQLQATTSGPYLSAHPYLQDQVSILLEVCTSFGTEYIQNYFIFNSIRFVTTYVLYNSILLTYTEKRMQAFETRYSRRLLFTPFMTHHPPKKIISMTQVCHPRGTSLQSIRRQLVDLTTWLSPTP